MIAIAKHDPTPDGWTEIPEWEMCESSVLKLNCPCDESVVPNKLTVTIGDCPYSLATVVPASYTVTVGDLSRRSRQRQFRKQSNG